MKTYLDLLVTDSLLNVELQLVPIGTPDISVKIFQQVNQYRLFHPIKINLQVPIDQTFDVEIQLQNKIYTLEYETAVVISKFAIDDIDISPRFDYLAVYENDHNNTDPTSYLGFNGKWTLTFDRPFYQWLHQVTAQGWLLS